jgi:hypothetical protein
MPSDALRPRKWPYILAITFVLLIALASYISYRARGIEPRIRAWVVQELSRRFNSQVELGALHARLWPRLGITGENLSIHFHNRTDVPPLIHVEKFAFNLGILGVFRAPRHIADVQLQNMVITIPPRQPGEQKDPSAPRTPFPTMSVIVDRIDCDDTRLLILPKKAGKEPLDFEIHNLVLKSVGADTPFDFVGTLTNAKPKGEIATTGKFGPWDADDPGNSAVSGNYKFTDANLDPFPGIGGTLSSTGQYAGQLNKIEVTGVTDTPNFSIDPVGRAVPLHTDFSATVDGTDGDTYLHPVRAVLGHSVITANGSVVRVPAKQGHLITLDVVAPQAHLEDLLALALKADKPPMLGVINLKTRLVIPPEKSKVIDKLFLEGDFIVNDAKFTSPEIREKLESFSRHALGKPEDDSAGSAITDLKGHFRLDRAVTTFQNLSFGIEGASLLLNGTYNLHEAEMDFHGQLKLQAELSQVVGGKKSIFLKPLDPLFKKNGAGTELPISITGKQNAPTFGVSIFHKTIKRQLNSPPAP